MVKLELDGEPRKFVAANGERLGDMGEKTIPFKIRQGSRRNIKLAE